MRMCRQRQSCSASSERAGRRTCDRKQQQQSTDRREVQPCEKRGAGVYEIDRRELDGWASGDGGKLQSLASAPARWVQRETSLRIPEVPCKRHASVVTNRSKTVPSRWTSTGAIAEVAGWAATILRPPGPAPSSAHPCSCRELAAKRRLSSRARGGCCESVSRVPSEAARRIQAERGETNR